MARAAILIVIPSVLVLASFAGQPPNLEKALEAQRQLVSQQPYDPQARNDLGNLLLLAGRVGEAEQAYRRAVELDYQGTSARFNLAALMQQSGRDQEAQDELRELLTIDEYHAWGHYQLGVLLEQEGERSKAIEHYARAFAYDPNLTFAETNPHIIDNSLTTEALLMSQRFRRPQASGVPRLYSNPDRIVDLMLEESETESGEAAAQEDSGIAPDGMAPEGGSGTRLPSGSVGDSGGDLRVEPDAAEEDEEEDEPQRRVLTPASVESGSRNQVSGTSSSSGSARPSSREALREAFEERFRAARERAQPTDSSTGGRSSSGSSSAGSGNPANRNPSGVRNIRRPRYIPGRASTGRLELEIRPSSGTADERWAAAVEPTDSGDSAPAAKLDAVDEDRRRAHHPAAHG